MLILSYQGVGLDGGTSRMFRELGLMNGRHFDVVRLEEDVERIVRHDVVWAGLGGGEGSRGCGAVLHAIQIQPLAQR